MAAKEREYKSLAKMREEAIRQHGEMVCVKCGCRQFRTSNTWQTNGLIRRRRVCRNCGYAFPTIETPVPPGKHI